MKEIIIATYDSYGNTYVLSEGIYVHIQNFTGNLHANTRLYTGREYDTETNLYYYRARYYDPSLGRFVSRDPIGMKDSVNLYMYVQDNPVKYTDPMGREKKFIQAHDVTDIILQKFNKGGITLENISRQKYGYAKVLNFLGSNISSNTEDYNIKYNKTLLSKSDHGYVYVGGVRTHVSDLGNMLYGYVAEKGGVGWEMTDSAAYTVNLDKEIRRSSYYIDGVWKNYYNEREDRQLYDVGYLLAENTKTGNLKQEDLVTYLKAGLNKSERVKKMPAFGEYIEAAQDYFK